MKVIDRESYENWKAKNDDEYGAGVFRYVERWADMMEERISNGATVAEAAEATEHEADTEGITGFMYGCAVSILAKCWVHGDELRRWHNLKHQLGDEGEQANDNGGVLNPAVLNIDL